MFRLARMCLVLGVTIQCHRDVAAETPPSTAPTATVGKSAKGKPERSGVAEVKFSHKRGLFGAPFDLTLTSKTAGATIRYTTDGSKPAANVGKVYAGPIRIAGTTVFRAAAFRDGLGSSSIKTHSFVFPEDVVQQSPDGLPPEGFPFTWGKNQVDYGMDPRVVNDLAIRAELLAGLRALPSFSLVTDLDSMFGTARGVYSNPGEQGRESEREMSLEYLPAGGGEDFQIDCGVRIRGGFSRMPVNPKHAFRLFFRDDYGEGKLKFPLFGPEGVKSFDSFDLRTAQNYSWSLAGDHRGVFVRDQFNRDLQRAMGHPAARGEFCHLYLNGQYWGLFNTCERPEASYAASHFGGKKESYDVIKVDSGYTTRASTYQIIATDGDAAAWNRLYERASQGLQKNADYFALQGCNPDGVRDPSREVLLDVDNLIDYMLVIFWGGNLDAPISSFGDNRNPNNFHAIRPRDGRFGFRFFIWDAEHTLLDPGENRLGPFRTGDTVGTSSPQWLWQQCLENPEFRLRVADRVQRHFGAGGVLEPKSVTDRFVARTRQIESAILAESARWGDVPHTFRMGLTPRLDEQGQPVTGPLGRGDWQREVSRLVRGYLPVRTEVVRGQLFAAGALPDLEPPEVVRERGRAVGLRHPLAAAELYFTTDGSDPRQVGGGVKPAARKLNGALPPDAPTLKARARLGEDWSALMSVP